MTEPDRLNALSERITALTGRNLTRDELVTVAGRAFEHRIDLDDDGQLRALLGGLSSGGGVGLGGPPVTYGQPAVPSYPVAQPGYPQIYPQPGWPAMNPMMAPGYPLMAPPPRAPKAPTRHPAGFIVGGILIALAALAGVFLPGRITYSYLYGFYDDRYYYVGSLRPWMLIDNADWVILAVGFLVVALSARGATRVSAIIAAGAALLTALVNIVTRAFLYLHIVPAIALVVGPTLIFIVGLLLTGLTGRRSFGVFGLVTAIGYTAISTVKIVASSADLYAVVQIAFLLSALFLLLFGIAVSCGKALLPASPGPVYPSYPDPGPPSGPVPPDIPDGTPAADAAP